MRDNPLIFCMKDDPCRFLYCREPLETRVRYAHNESSAGASELYLASLIGGSRSIQGWASGTAMDSEDTLNFSTLRHVRPLIETFPLERADEAYNRMMSNQVRFRAVLTPQQQ
jgi:D-arabinose 1-dehydrogenase-like Zn-dependent alcohol dehydrogenase